MTGPIDDALVRPEHTVLVTMECQRGIIGDLSGFADLRAAAAPTIDPMARLCRAARAGGVRVVHCTAENRRDGAGSVENCRMLAASARLNEAGAGIWTGSPGAEVVPELEVSAADVVVPRLHGLTPFTATSLDQIIRNLGARTVVAVGVSVNIGVLGLVLSAVDLGYQVVVPSDAVAGVPIDYGHAVLQNTIRLLATITTTDVLASAWTQGG